MTSLGSEDKAYSFLDQTVPFDLSLETTKNACMNRINISDLSGQIDGSGEFLTVQIRPNLEVDFTKQLNSS